MDLSALEIIHYPHPTLRHTSRPIQRVDDELRDIIRHMFPLMYEARGVGLAANQIDLPLRVFITNLEVEPEEGEERVFINPVISQTKGIIEQEEGCLSIPGVLGPVVRQEKITVEAYDLTGEAFCSEVEGLFARGVQHEVDHLDGKLFIDRLAPGQAAELREALEEFEIDYRSKRECGEMPSDEAVAARLAELEKLRA